MHKHRDTNALHALHFARSNSHLLPCLLLVTSFPLNNPAPHFFSCSMVSFSVSFSPRKSIRQHFIPAELSPTEADGSTELPLTLCHAGIVKGEFLSITHSPRGVQGNSKAPSTCHHLSLAVWIAAVTDPACKVALQQRAMIMSYVLLLTALLKVMLWLTFTAHVVCRARVVSCPLHPPLQTMTHNSQ